jgi:hypothetical protein
VENIPTAEFGMISTETACWDIERKKPNFNEDFYLPLYLSLWYLVWVSQKTSIPEMVAYHITY